VGGKGRKAETEGWILNGEGVRGREEEKGDNIWGIGGNGWEIGTRGGGFSNGGTQIVLSGWRCDKRLI